MIGKRGVVTDTKTQFRGRHSASRFIRQDSFSDTLSDNSSFCHIKYGEGGFFMSNKSRKSIRILTGAAMLTAMSIVIGTFCKNFMNFGNGLFRITFENLPIIISGMLFGPVAGGAVGLATDLISYLMSSQTYPPNIIVMVGATLVGVTSGVFSKYVIKKNGYARIIISSLAAHLVGSLVVKTVGLFSYYGWAVLVRIPLYLLAIAPAEIFIICLMYKNSAIRKLFGWNGKETK